MGGGNRHHPPHSTSHSPGVCLCVCGGGCTGIIHRTALLTLQVCVCVCVGGGGVQASSTTQHFSLSRCVCVCLVCGGVYRHHPPRSTSHSPGVCVCGVGWGGGKGCTGIIHHTALITLQVCVRVGGVQASSIGCGVALPVRLPPPTLHSVETAPWHVQAAPAARTHPCRTQTALPPPPHMTDPAPFWALPPPLPASACPLQDLYVGLSPYTAPACLLPPPPPCLCLSPSGLVCGPVPLHRPWCV